MKSKGLDVGHLRESLLSKMLGHVVFDGWSEVSLKAAMAEAGVPRDLLRVIVPRGVLDLAADYHRHGDQQMLDRLAAADLSALRFRDKIARAVRLRIEAADRELVRRGAAFFALPQNALTGSQLIWGTADAIWTALGDTSDDFNWYTKRATLAAVYSATVLYWLGDESPGHEATWAFLDRRIADVMRIEELKARTRENPLAARIIENTSRVFGKVRPPRIPSGEMPGFLTRRR